ncbi:unnamed protein product [Brachionus calyciflorus]|uniref:HAT C-terminal dimerisation domain-containing protein n=1 Tax=Brachionus calyciflorus TaxID=104777 RepID=A0A814PYN4_9BILA|nr:unnamed protein product [Brachionus calyciflorus]
MIVSSLRIKKSLDNLASNPEYDISELCLENDEWACLDDLKKILDPFKKATLDLSSNNFSISHLYLIFNHLKHHINSLALNQNFVIFRTAFNEMNLKFKKYWDEIEEFALFTHVLDARFKASIIERDKKDLIKLKIKNLINNISNDEELLNNQNFTQDFSSHETSLVHSILLQNDLVNNDQNEVDKYFSSPLLGQNSDPIEWWSSNIKDYPKMGKIAMGMIAACSTSVPSERFFSVSGLTVNKLRTRLTPDKVNKLMVLWSWNRFLTSNNDFKNN